MVCLDAVAGVAAGTGAGKSTLKVTVNASVDIPSLDRLTGEATYSVTNTGNSELSEIHFMLYPNQFTQLSENIPVYAREWIYPNGFSPGELTVHHVREVATGKDLPVRMTPFQIGKSTADRFIMEIALPTPVAVGQTISLHIRYAIAIPERRGRFGYFDGVLSLAGGWLPRPTPMDNTDWRSPYPVDLTLSVKLPAGMGGYVIDQVVTDSNQRQTIDIDKTGVAEPTVILMDRMELRSVARPEGNIHYLTNHYVESPESVSMDPGIKAHRQKRKPLTAQAKRIRRTVEIIDDVRALFPPDQFPKKDFYVIEIPAWDRLSQVSDDVLLLSDRTFEVVPYPQALMFHMSDVARTVATLVAQPYTRKDGSLSEFAAEIVGYHFQQRYLQVAKEKREELAQLLRFLAFNPYVDNLIYAPQMPFEHAYVRSIEETDIFRGELWRTLNSLPRGKRIVAKLEDLLDREETQLFFDAYLQGDQCFLSLLNQRLEMGSRFAKQWFGKYPIVGYALGKSASERAGNTYHHTVEVIQNGEPIAEPVTVLLTDRDNQTTRLKWDGMGTHATLTWQSDAPLKSVQIDPDYRLVETAKVQGHPMSDNARPLGMRPPLLTDLTAWGDSVTREPFMLIAFSFRRKYDISNSFQISASHTPRQNGGSLGYFRHFGYNRTLNARTWYAGPRLGLYKYLDATATEPGIHKNNRYTATLASINILAGMDDRRFLLDPQFGKSFQISLGYWVGKSKDNGVVQHAKGSLRVFKVIPLALGHTLVAYGGISAVIGQPPASNLVTLSHAQILRGFDLGETYGRVGVYAVSEYRHTLIGSTSLEFPLRTLLSRVQGVLFVGAGSASRPETYRTLFQPERNFAEVGYGLRFHFLLMGAVPYLLALDFVVPIHPTDRRYTVVNDDRTESHYPREPWRIAIGFTQTF